MSHPGNHCSQLLWFIAHSLRNMRQINSLFRLEKLWSQCSFEFSIAQSIVQSIVKWKFDSIIDSDFGPILEHYCLCSCSHCEYIWRQPSGRSQFGCIGVFARGARVLNSTLLEVLHRWCTLPLWPVCYLILCFFLWIWVSFLLLMWCCLCVLSSSSLE